MTEHAKQKSPRMLVDPSASAEQSSVRGTYVDPNRLVLTITLNLLIFIINVLLPFPNSFLQKCRRIQRKLPQSGVKTTPVRRFDRSSGVPIGHGGYLKNKACIIKYRLHKIVNKLYGRRNLHISSVEKQKV